MTPDWEGRVIISETRQEQALVCSCLVPLLQGLKHLFAYPNSLMKYRIAPFNGEISFLLKDLTSSSEMPLYKGFQRC